MMEKSRFWRTTPAVRRDAAPQSATPAPANQAAPAPKNIAAIMKAMGRIKAHRFRSHRDREARSN